MSNLLCTILALTFLYPSFVQSTATYNSTSDLYEWADWTKKAQFFTGTTSGPRIFAQQNRGVCSFTATSGTRVIGLATTNTISDSTKPAYEITITDTTITLQRSAAAALIIGGLQSPASTYWLALDRGLILVGTGTQPTLTTLCAAYKDDAPLPVNCFSLRGRGIGYSNIEQSSLPEEKFWLSSDDFLITKSEYSWSVRSSFEHRGYGGLSCTLIATSDVYIGFTDDTNTLIYELRLGIDNDSHSQLIEYVDGAPTSRADIPFCLGTEPQQIWIEFTPQRFMFGIGSSSQDRLGSTQLKWDGQTQKSISKWSLCCKRNYAGFILSPQDSPLTLSHEEIQ